MSTVLDLAQAVVHDSQGLVYLLHFHEPYHHARHYLGSAEDLEKRLDQHRRGVGARLVHVISQAGISFTLARTWKGGRKKERRLKNQHHNPRLCPICNPRLRR